MERLVHWSFSNSASRLVGADGSSLVVSEATLRTSSGTGSASSECILWLIEGGLTSAAHPDSLT